MGGDVVTTGLVPSGPQASTAYFHDSEEFARASEILATAARGGRITQRDAAAVADVRAHAGFDQRSLDGLEGLSDDVQNAIFIEQVSPTASRSAGVEANLAGM